MKHPDLCRKCLIHLFADQFMRLDMSYAELQTRIIEAHGTKVGEGLIFLINRAIGQRIRKYPKAVNMGEKRHQCQCPGRRP